VDAVDEPSDTPFESVDSMIPQRPGQTPEDRAKDIANVLAWIRDNRVDVVDDDKANKITI
jgi:hypothetical protein